MIRFDGREIFGRHNLRQVGPAARTRNMREQLPGVVGYRNYRLTGGIIDTRIWQVTGWQVESSLRAAEQFIEAGLAYVDGAPYVFESTGGLRHRNCELTAFGPSANFFRVILPNGLSQILIQIQATIEQMSPER
jgi:hypothetical protein